MKGILADVNIEGYIDLLVAFMQSEPWKLFWDHLRLRYVRFAEVGLSPASPDSLVWETCQKMGLRHGRDYADRVIESLLTYLLQAENTRGTGRLYLP